MKIFSRDIIVVGASAGGVEALQKLVAALPHDLPAAVFVVMHIPPWSPSELPSILSKSGPLPVEAARSHHPFQHGRIYVAPPDIHLLVEESEMVLWRGPKENRHRPAVNTLFRSAAVAHGERVIAVVLSGSLDDGSAGVWWVKRYGGLAVVQDPSEAIVPEMPRNALEYADSAYISRVSAMGSLLTQLVAGETPPTSWESAEQKEDQEFHLWTQKRA